MTFHLPAFETPAHFRRRTNCLSRKCSLLTPPGDRNIHAAVLATSCGSGGANSVQPPRNGHRHERLPELGGTASEVAMFAANGRQCGRFRGSHCRRIRDGRQGAARLTYRQERKR